MTVLRNDKLKALVEIPPITLELYTRYWAARIEHAAQARMVGEREVYNPGEVVAEQLAGLLAIATRAEVDGQPLTAQSPLRAIRWAVAAVDKLLADEIATPNV